VAEQADNQAVDFMLAADEVMAALCELHVRGGLDDAFGRVPDEVERQKPHIG
jgi:hypothetical protein